MLIVLIGIFFSPAPAQTRAVSLAAQSSTIGLSNNDELGFNLHYSIGELQIRNISTGKGVFDLVTVDGYGHSRMVGEPMLPVSTKIIQVPLGANPVFSVLKRENILLGRMETRLLHPIMPAQESVSKSSDPARISFEIDEALYRSDTFSSTDLFQLEEIGILRGVRLFQITYSPISYNPVKQELEICKTADIRVDFPGADLAASHELLSKTASFEFEQLYRKSIFNWIPERNSLLHHPTKMLILCPPAYESTMAPFIEWKRKEGMIVNLVTVGSGATIANSSSAIKSYMQSIWNGATELDPAPSYLIIVGDHSLSGNNITSNSGETGSHITDLSYVRLSGTDYLPEMYHGRFSVSNTTELQNVINKSLMFARTSMPDLDYLGKTVLIAGVDASWAPTHGNGAINYATAHYFNAAHGITSNNYYYPESGSSASQIVANAAEGRGYMNYTAHGGQTSWANPSFSASQMMSLTNTNKPFVAVGNCCITNEFDYGSPCFGEAVIRSNNAGAAYIGGINSTYWDEDFYWAVGYKTPQTAAHAYDPNKLGAYDAMFHAPNSVADWAQTTGETIFMGNMAVQASTSSLKNYYWEIYHLMGDPSLKPYYGVPTVNNVTFPQTILMTLNNITVSAEPYSRVALSKDGNLAATGIVPASGSLNLNFNPFTSIGNADLVITRSGKITREETIEVLPASGPYMTIESITYADSNNNQPDFDESGRFNTSFKNSGVASVNSVTATLSCSSTGITITDASETISSLAAGASITRANAFAFNIANNVADGSMADFTVTMTAAGETWVHNFSLEINAPALSFGSIAILDPSGNNNGRLDPGETVTLMIPLLNSGNSAGLSGSATLTSPTAGITINAASTDFSPIAAGASTSLSFNLSASSSMSVGAIANLVFNASAGAYSANKTEFLAVGLVLEDFESGDFDSFPWIMSGNMPWTIDDAVHYEGIYSAKSGLITHSQSTSMSTTRILTEPGTLTFRYKVSSESGYDYLRFYIDGVQQNQWSGNVDWAEATYELATGTRELTWTYRKDSSVSSGSDCAWVDYIVFPSSHTPTSFYPPQNLSASPGNQQINLAWEAPLSGSPTSYRIFRNDTHIIDVTDLSYLDTDLTNGTEYSYYVVAAYPGGESDPSNTIIAIPGESSEAVIGSGVNATYATDPNPLSIYYKSRHGQSVYTAAELVAAGISGPGAITHIGFNVYQAPSLALPNFVIRMKHTSDANVANWQSATGMQLVYSNASYLPIAGSFEMLPLSTPFMWNGVDNIVIDTAFGLAEEWNSSGGLYTTSIDNGYRYIQSDSVNLTDAFSGGYTSANRPNLKLRFQPASADEALIFVNPTALEYEDTIVGESSSLNLSITNSGNIPLEGSITTPAGFSIAQRSSALQSKTHRNTIDFLIASGADISYTVSFNPDSATDFSGNITITSNAENDPNLNIPVIGSGYLPPTISISTGGISQSLLIGEEGSDSFTISNTGGEELNFSITFSQDSRAISSDLSKGMDRSIAGSYLSIDPTAYLPGSTMDLEVSVYNGSTDTEWLKEVILTIPAGITINNVTDMTGGSAPLTPTILANEITWYGESSSGWGLIQGSETGLATVNISIPSDQSGDMEFPYTINGDIYNDEPHTISDTFVLTQDAPPITWLNLSSTSGSLASGASETITASFSAAGMSEGIYSATLIINSNDPQQPQVSLEASMEVIDVSNHPPVINLPESFSFDKNRGLPIDMSLYVSDPDNDPLSIQIVGNTNVLSDVDGLDVVLSATQNWVGSETLTFIVSDGELSSSDQALVSVLPVNVPAWEAVQYPNNPATIYATVNIEGFPASANDQLAAFVESECRGVADIVLTRDTACATIIVQLANANETVYFRVYSYSTDTIYESMTTVEPDFGEEIGVGSPVEIDAGTITELDSPVVALQFEGSSMQLSWTPVLHAQGYEIWHCNRPDGDFQYLAYSSTPTYPLSPGQNRAFYRVKAIRGIPAK